MDLEKGDNVYVQSREEEGEFVGVADESDKVLVDIDKEHSYRGVIEVERELVEKR
jgi:hypothetical protein